MELGIRRASGFADYESGGRRGSDKNSHFYCIINLLLTHFWIYFWIELNIFELWIDHHLLILLIDLIISCY